ncbi:hypothetical protein EHI8A_027300 [Entamoeba histolytica HM-1:IMSS-B]|uniref:Uncharacterized protein n=6 Tax=Entamoeba histolytica TaxID=5759 RepID=C4LX71_ENTH1|nr:hypothetical protein EHI_013000 [Entamoeba histolytica HM-1:IMSS]EMD49441.1 Hypothetical protein EHI5A_010410 [Entamoeba histolytica KU27]EMH78206.1 hypothetical protein EHI8A_027300 [Entamoeba histolytica HM-1:IMSS-B]EMS17007.1 hypothetical protein KM1_012060 [Entamoeba histolytica HM-3:IMSS]ENY61536.1 hypothetical protein EHI7A_030130 [Entamoeba histolytica HM-1:IMSS-A]GAT93337.1 hypothetical protein CL6EHI_013000 [Entamoeba histolytica]|eukprot:XP_656346.1 hypothetical protein EHI_013000 [Entamoeba histolytica HM-1:IMSS]
MYVLFVILIAKSLAGEIVYANKERGWELNDSALIDYYDYEINGTYWLGGEVQRFDTLKFNGYANTVELDQLCWTVFWTSEDSRLKFKVRMYPHEFRDDESPDTGLVVNGVTNNTETCVNIRNNAFDPRCGSVIKYVSIQIYQTLSNDKSFVYFNDIKFSRKRLEIDSNSTDDSSSQVVDGSISIYIAVFCLLMFVLI